MRIRVLKDHDFTPEDERRVTVAFKADTEVTTKREWGEALVAVGAAKEVRAPKRASSTPKTPIQKTTAPSGTARTASPPPSEPPLAPEKA